MKCDFTINLNDTVKVKLTDHGKDIYYHQLDGIDGIEPHLPNVDKEGYTHIQLWYFMQLYGEHIGMFKENVIYPLEIHCNIKNEV